MKSKENKERGKRRKKEERMKSKENKERGKRRENEE